MTNDPTLWSATRQAQAIATGQLTSRDLLERMIDRIEQLPDVNAVITRDFEDARKRCDAADRLTASGATLPPLHGLPITIKDALETRGVRSTGGAEELADNIPDRDAPVVQAVKDAGAIVFGKTNLPRWSGDIQAYNKLFGTTSNPWDLSRVPGGSSGGAAAAVATGMTAFEIGTDIGGSIRFPSAFCGVFGHKPSFGIVPSTGYLDHKLGGTTEADVNVIGPIARSADDLELLLSILLRREGPRAATLAEPRVEVNQMRVAAWLDDAFCPVDAAVLDRLAQVVQALRGAGIAVDTSARPQIDPGEASRVGFSLVGAAVNYTPGDGQLGHADWLELHRQREVFRQRWVAFFADWDIVLMPVSFVPPFPHLHEGNFTTRTLTCNGATRPYSDIVRWTILTGMAYLPVTVPPIGLDSSGLPVGIQVVGPYGGDRSTMWMAATIADLMGGYVAPPCVGET